MAPGTGRDFNCSWEHCGKSFNRKSDLCRHYRIHTNERPYHCTVQDCNKSFIQRSALTVHSRTHTGEKPHVCDHEGCHKAFSDSSSLARHRRIHTGKRPYICQEPTCERSFCRKTTLTKHQHRSHPPGVVVARTPSEDAVSEQSYPAPITLLTQQAYYPNASTPTHEFYSHPNLPMTPVAVPEQPPMGTQPVPVTSPVEVQHAQQQYLQLVQQQQQQQQQRYNHPRTGYLPPEFQPAYVGLPTGDGHPIMVSYTPSFQYKQPTRILNQPEGTDWTFLGVGS
ncbi:hypothetical protein P175DRAFT_0485630 [Aspergillus ochraceoroseus IBT 24754]|uniref:C2H2-type domain-containing protein n=1 Tax=Aspergillus ochraceoroseus IBT 24754 TaxID=1392256 RepID=A0A2T5LPR8_9EURO|nr:uncharacterized protein P175DRAFT_0485630 [Aspergillus ochraceoroseus IBT 24754]PTU18279.1 hypothetical protein P175DRAFT_0485630 [Aspergillus ochraceoroseus IBT 24754]